LDLYQTAVRPILFSGLKADPERVQQRVIQLCAQIQRRGNQPPVQWLQQQIQRSCSLSDPRLQQTLWGLSFPNPIGLAAGFDKDGVASRIWSSFGFGYAELGTVTYHAQPGNPRPRLFRLPLDRAAINRLGFNNQGAAQMAAVLKQSQHPSRIPIGINLGKSKVTPLDQAVEDYLSSFRLLQDLGDYFVVNVSSPNTPGLRSLQAAEQLGPLLAALQQENRAGSPLLIKISPDLEWDAIAAILELAQVHQLAGIIATNTTIQRPELKTRMIQATGNAVTQETGGLSGAPLQQRSTEVVRFIWQQTQGKLPIIGVGGIFTAEDAWKKILAGASLVQVYTGWVYKGPWMVRRILEGLQYRLAQQGLSTFTEAVGLEGSTPVF